MKDLEIERARRLKRMAEKDLVEKLLKAWIAALDEEYPYNHDIGRLLNRLDANKQDVMQFRHLVRYMPFAARFRYEELVAPEDALDRAAALADARALFDHVSAIIAGQAAGAGDPVVQ